jgi:hypothetical protein
LFPTERWDFDGVCSLGAALFNDSRLKLADSKNGEELFWLRGTEGLEQWEALPPASSDCSAMLQDSGYFVGRKGGDWLCMDAGPVADGLHADATPSTAHGHLDTLQVLYCRNEQPVLIDPGMPFYFGDAEWVSHFRGSEAHNTIQIDGLAVARDAGGLQWSHVIAPPELVAGHDAEVWTATGTLRLERDCLVERSVACLPGLGLWIADFITLDRPRRIRWLWQMGCPFRIGSQDAADHVFAHSDELVLAGWSSGRTPTVHIESSVAESPVAWRAPGYGVLTPGCRITEELSGEQRAFKVLFVGAEPQPFQISRPGHILASDKNIERPLREVRIGTTTWRVPAGRQLEAGTLETVSRFTEKHPASAS